MKNISKSIEDYVTMHDSHKSFTYTLQSLISENEMKLEEISIFENRIGKNA